MFPVIQTFVRWITIPALLIASMLSRYAGEYACAAGLGVAVIAFGPLLVVDKHTVPAAFRRQPVAASL